MLSVCIDNNIIYTSAEGKLTDDDYDRLIPLLEEKMRNYGKIRWYFEMQKFESLSISSLWREQKLGFNQSGNLERIAMVGDQNWENELTQLMKPFTGAQIRYFKRTESDEAKNWIKKIEL